MTSLDLLINTSRASQIISETFTPKFAYSLEYSSWLYYRLHSWQKESHLYIIYETNWQLWPSNMCSHQKQVSTTKWHLWGRGVFSDYDLIILDSYPDQRFYTGPWFWYGPNSIIWIIMHSHLNLSFCARFFKINNSLLPCCGNCPPNNPVFTQLLMKMASKVVKWKRNKNIYGYKLRIFFNIVCVIWS